MAQMLQILVCTLHPETVTPIKLLQSLQPSVGGEVGHGGGVGGGGDGPRNFRLKPWEREWSECSQPSAPESAETAPHIYSWKSDFLSSLCKYVNIHCPDPRTLNRHLTILRKR
jgi:hypothetical protein